MCNVIHVKCQFQRDSQRGRAISGFSRTNDADYDDNDIDDNQPPRKYGRRGYRSNCRCAKISNCPKLQITIPRCPPEEFVCCFN
ncbi:hypothetical protein Phum_PHUM128940 [Pediculus humanus corporis]|uniref:Uncharacterized protein n=1 Tax=Pediculus humanus subsp. corporis TaxID=121224 RepID=E0VE75_PEDHC|nr:uncharacterized protein Phum_PHUM128940 [Pediculus humanus corporis]EEB11681.1 hypothetical protein Phum_PHUM128940 [Pediculus humanus corporis]